MWMPRKHTRVSDYFYVIIKPKRSFWEVYFFQPGMSHNRVIRKVSNYVRTYVKLNYMKNLPIKNQFISKLVKKVISDQILPKKGLFGKIGIF